MASEINFGQFRATELGIRDVRSVSYSGGTYSISCWHDPVDLKRILESAGFRNVETWIDTYDIPGMTQALFDERTDGEQGGA